MTGGKTGKLLVISAPSGAGKTTLVKRLLARMPGLYYSVSLTTRGPRPGESEGVDYHFVSREEFQEKIAAGHLAEWAEVHGNFYGTDATLLRAAMDRGRSVILDIDVKGARQIKERFPDAATLFIAPPSMEELKRRLVRRGTDDPATIRKRLTNAEWEMAQQGEYQRVIVNDDLDAATEELVKAVKEAGA